MSESSKGPFLDAQRIETLWRVVQRFDEYLRAADVKATVVATFDLFIISTALLRLDGLEIPHAEAALLTRMLAYTAMALFLIAAAGAFASLVSIAAAVKPFLDSPERPGLYHSVLFFGHVARDLDASDYRARIAQLDEQVLLEDLGAQAHALAKGANRKYQRLGQATRLITGAAVVMFAALVLSLICGTL